MLTAGLATPTDAGDPAPVPRAPRAPRAPRSPLGWGLYGLKIVAAVGAAIYLVYLLVANLLLVTGLLDTIVSHDPATVRLETEGAWTLWFGRVHVRRLALQGSASTLEWALHTEHASLDIRLHELLARRLHADRIRGDNLVFRLRMRLTRDEADSPRARALPPIPGFHDPPLLLVGPPSEGPDDAHYNLWTTHLEDVDVGVSEIWIEHYRYVGQARTRGGFLLKPQRIIEVTPSILDVHGGEITLAEHTVVRDTEGRIDCTIEARDPRTIQGIDMFRSVSSRVAVDAQIPDLGFIAFYVPPSNGTTVVDGSGQLRTDLSLDHGVLGSGSSLTYETEHVDILTPEIGTTLGGRFVVHTADDPQSTSTTLTAHLPRATIDRRRLEVPPAIIENSTLTLTVPVLDVSDPPRKAGAKLDVPTGVVPDLRWLNGATHPAADIPRFTGGAAFFQISAEMSPEGRGESRIGLKMKKATLHWRDLTLRGDSEGKLHVETADVFTERATVGKSHLELRDVVLTRKGDADYPWWGDIDVEHAEIEKKLIGVSFRASLKDSQPAIDFLEAGDVLPDWAAVLMRVQPVTLDARIEHRDDTLHVDILHGRGGSLDIRGRLKRPDHGKVAADFLIKSGPLSVGLAIGKDGVGVKPLEGDDWLDRSMAALGK